MFCLLYFSINFIEAKLHTFISITSMLLYSFGLIKKAFCKWMMELKTPFFIRYLFATQHIKRYTSCKKTWFYEDAKSKYLKIRCGPNVDFDSSILTKLLEGFDVCQIRHFLNGFFVKTCDQPDSSLKNTSKLRNEPNTKHIHYNS